ncbi:hypothetical protein [Streptomyces sp. NPDC088131]|uniref:hypothetical protein n=1 Tax=Streptomyces sp. NPDC088131 TaxID=3365826 RepID=UPI00380C3E4F
MVGQEVEKVDVLLAGAVGQRLVLFCAWDEIPREHSFGLGADSLPQILDTPDLRTERPQVLPSLSRAADSLSDLLLPLWHALPLQAVLADHFHRAIHQRLRLYVEEVKPLQVLSKEVEPDV